MAAPSASDIRPWAFIVVRDPERRQALAETHRWSTMCAHAPVVIAVVGDPAAADHWVEDCSAATENLLLAAAGLDLGAVWVAVYPRPQREAHVRQVLDIPERLRPLCLVPVGHPATTKSPRTRYEESKVHDETFGSNPAIMAYVQAQQQAQAFLPEVNMQISQLLGFDFGALAGAGSC